MPRTSDGEWSAKEHEKLDRLLHEREYPTRSVKGVSIRKEFVSTAHLYEDDAYSTGWRCPPARAIWRPHGTPRKSVLTKVFDKLTGWDSE